MYSFVRGARLFVKGAREPDDPDNLPDPGDSNGVDDRHVSVYHHQTRSQMASASQESKEVFRTAHNRSGLRTVHTSRVVRKTTTLTRGDQKIPMRTSGTQHEAIRSSSVASMTSSLGGRENGTQTRDQNNSKSIHHLRSTDTVDHDVQVKRVHKVYDSSDTRKKIRTNKVSVSSAFLFVYRWGHFKRHLAYVNVLFVCENPNSAATPLFDPSSFSYPNNLSQKSK